MTDEWGSAQLDLDAYLTRIGHQARDHGALEPDGPTLAGLHRAHTTAIPFENIDLVLGWLADVGFGAGLTAPIEWDDTARPHRQGSWTYRLVRTPTDEWLVQQAVGDQWSVLYSFTTEPQHASDVKMANHYTSTHPDSPFLGHLVVMRKIADRQYRLRDRQLLITHSDGTREETSLDDVLIMDMLRTHFLLALDPDKMTRLTSALPDREPEGAR